MIKRTNLKNWLAVVFLFVVSPWACQSAYGQPWDGNGVEGDPYQIWAAADMQAIGADSNYWDGHFKLMADIDLSAYTGTSFNIIGYWVSYSDNIPFTGVFDGSGHTISNFNYSTPSGRFIGLFGFVSDVNAEIKDLGLTNPDVDAGTGENVGGLAGWVGYGEISGCYVEGGNVAGEARVGGLVGHHAHDIEFKVGAISNCYSTASVSGNSSVGGLVGYFRAGSICNSYASGTVTGTAYVGGLVGINFGGTINNCYATGSISGVELVGGLVGGSSRGYWITGGTISNCYSTGSVSGNDKVGGLVGSNWSRWHDGGTISNCYSTGPVTGTLSVGGLVGKNGGTVYSSFWDRQTSGQASSAGGTGKTTAEMQNIHTFLAAGWDFVGERENGPSDDWAEPGGGGYMILWHQLSPLPPLPAFSGGTGEPNDPYLISTAQDLNRIGHNSRLMDKHFRLINDIDLDAVDFFTIGSLGSRFNGVFDGNGHEISDLTVNSNGRDYIGLFNYVNAQDAEIKDIGLIDPNIDAGTGVAIGSLVGGLMQGTVRGCYMEGGNVAGGVRVGALVGNCRAGSISNSYASGSVTGERYVGGFVGILSGTVSSCYSTGSVSGGESVGGFVGFNWGGLVVNCYSVGSLSRGGGLIGNSSDAVVTNSFWDKQTSHVSSSAGGTGKTTADMQDPNTFLDAGWDFVGEANNGVDDIWTFCESPDYPRLWWECPPSLEAEVKLVPDTLNLQSKGGWISCHILLPEGYNVAEIEPNSIVLEEEIRADRVVLEGKALMAKFSRSALQEILGDLETPAEVELLVSGQLSDGTIFEAADTITVIDKANKEYSGLQAWARSVVSWGRMVVDSNDFAGGNFIAVAAGGYHSLALKADGRIVGWASNYYGQATPPSGNDFVAISAGGDHSLALKGDGSVVGWGSNKYGQATPPSGNDFVAISGGNWHSLAIKADGSIAGWGDNYRGQAAPPSGNDFVAVSAGGSHSLALKADGSIVGWGRNTSGQATPPSGNDFVAISAGDSHSLALKADGSIVGWGRNGSGQATPPPGNDFVAVSAGRDHGLALKADGSIVGWGYNRWGGATPPSGNDFVAISAGGGHSLAIKADGSIAGWGSNYYGQAAPPSGNDFVAVSAGRDHGLALKADGNIVGWGRNRYGQDVPPPGNDFVAISAGGEHSLAIKADGSIAGWGHNDGGQAGPPSGNDFVAISAGGSHSLALKADGSIVGWGRNYDDQATPPSGNDFVAVSAGWEHSLALKADGSIAGWGSNYYGQATPPSGNDFVAVSAGAWHSLALKADGTIVGWGAGTQDFGDWPDYGQAAPPSGNDFVAVSAGDWHSLALKADGSIVGWGLNDRGQATPPSGNDFVAIAAGRYHSLAIKEVGPPPIEAEMKLTPKSLNCASRGKYIKAHITLAEGFLAKDVDVNEPALAEPVDVESEYIKILGNGDSPVKVEIGFDRQEFCDCVAETGQIEVTVSGYLTTGQAFIATDTVKIGNRGGRR